MKPLIFNTGDFVCSFQLCLVCFDILSVARGAKNCNQNKNGGIFMNSGADFEGSFQIGGRPPRLLLYLKVVPNVTFDP